MILAVLIGGGLVAGAQTPGAKADPVKVDPKHYKVEFENANVRVLRISYEAGEKSVMHSHPNSVAVYLTNATSRMTAPDGKSQDITVKANTTEWTPAGSHLPQNVGGKPLQLILVELKK